MSSVLRTTLQIIETLIDLNVIRPSTDRHERKLLLLRSYCLNLDPTLGRTVQLSLLSLTNSITGG
jgi:hypothetical protein